MSLPSPLGSAMSLLNTLPETTEEALALEVLRFDHKVRHGITDDDLAEVIPYCPNIKDAHLSGIHDLSDRTLVLLGQETNDLRLLDISRCRFISPIGVRDVIGSATKLQVLRLHGVWSLTDSVVITLVRSLGHLTELDLSDLPLVTAHSVREIWTFSKKLRILNLSDCVGLTVKGFPSLQPLQDGPSRRHSRGVVVNPSLPSQVESKQNEDSTAEASYKDGFSPLVLPPHHKLHHLRYLTFRSLPNLTDDAIIGTLSLLRHVIELSLGGCVQITDRIVQSLCNVGRSLEILDLSQADNITDNGIFRLARSCPKLQQVNISCKYSR